MIDWVQRVNSNIIGSTNITCTTFNVLAPIYKRVDQQVFLSLSSHHLILY